MTAAYRAHLPHSRSLVLVTGAYACVLRNSSRTASEHHDAFLSTSVLVFSFAPPPFHCGPCGIIFVRFLLIYHIFSSTCMSCILHIIYTGASSFSISYSLIRGTQLFVCSILSFLLDHGTLSTGEKLSNGQTYF